MQLKFSARFVAGDNSKENQRGEENRKERKTGRREAARLTISMAIELRPISSPLFSSPFYFLPPFPGITVAIFLDRNVDAALRHHHLQLYFSQDYPLRDSGERGT